MDMEEPHLALQREESSLTSPHISTLWSLIPRRKSLQLAEELSGPIWMQKLRNMDWRLLVLVTVWSEWPGTLLPLVYASKELMAASCWGEGTVP